MDNLFMTLFSERENSMEDGIRAITMTVPDHYIPDAVPSVAHASVAQ